MQIQHNISAMNSNRNLSRNRSALKKNLEKLSSGYAINRSADNVAGLAISEKMRAQISGLGQGENNISDGISLLQTADGALHEVTALLQRIATLSTQAANGTYDFEEKEKIQEEINQILREIDRISDDTKFNEIPLFQGSDEVILDANGTPTVSGEIPFKDFSLVDTSLNLTPFSNNSSGDLLAFQAIVTEQSSGVYGSQYRLIYSNGTTSDSSLRLTYEKDSITQTHIVDFDELTFTGVSGDITKSNDPLIRTFTYEKDDIQLKIDQKIHIEEDDKEKFYVISYEFTNTGTTEVTNAEFLFHSDTAYNEDDYHENYFINGQQVTQSSVYTSGNGLVLDSASSGTTPDSFSIVNEDKSLAFSEKIVFVGDKPDISFGLYYEVDDWSYYNNSSSNLGTNIDGTDLGFSLVWKLGDMGSSASKSVQFKYGIADVDKDSNLNDVTVTRDDSLVTEHSEYRQIWIQGSASDGDGMWLSIGEMNCRILGIDSIDVTSHQGAVSAIQQAENALKLVTTNLGNIGAYQNRLEHALQNNGVQKENLTASESRIRDTDMATEMMAYTKNNILIQASQAMLTQANQTPQGILQLMQ